MKSPFPGMDPFIETCGLWEDFHLRLVTAIIDALCDIVQDRYVVRGGERSYVVMSQAEDDEFQIQADVAVVAHAPPEKAGSKPLKSGSPFAAGVLEAPVAMQALVDTEHVEHFVEIYELQPQRRLVTCIEVLSPSNKRPNTIGWAQYARKRQPFLQGGANFVEIDLLREGEQMPMHSRWPASPYCFLVSRKQEAPRCWVWPAFSLRRLPKVAVPLAPPDPDVSLDVQPLIERIVERSGYARDIDYRAVDQPPLTAEESEWLQRVAAESSV
ncbi:MAG: DUF4058 family protein [Planctomycetales bacterium]